MQAYNKFIIIPNFLKKCIPPSILTKLTFIKKEKVIVQSLLFQGGKHHVFISDMPFKQAVLKFENILEEDARDILYQSLGTDTI